MQVKTGKGTISMMVVLAIWSLSLAVDLPGLAVTPIEGSLRHIFTDATDLKIQMLTVLPNLVIIPFVLLSGKLSETRHKVLVITLGTILYIVAGALSLFTNSLTALIWLSCLLGAGCGLILPFSTGLIADVFTGKYRMKQMGIISAIGNIALVLATFAVGFLVAGNLEHTWHRAFFVYLIPLLSLVLIPFLNKIPKSDYQDAPAATQADSSSSDQKAAATDAKTASSDAKTTAQATAAVADVDADGFSTKGQVVKGGFYIGRTIWLLLAYFFFVFATCIPSYYLPNFKWISSEQASIMTSTFYFAMFVVGIALTPVMKFFRKGTFIAAAAMLLLSFVLFVFVHDSVAVYIIAAALCGLGNGIAQPIFYTKATEVVTSDSKSTLSLAYLQVANYVAISLVPVIISAGEKIFHTTSTLFPFIFVGIATAIVFIFVIIRSRHFVFGMSKNYY
ncbi:MAG: MFS transporter [Muribaculaceae bacterium]|nr:MFS transporter [Muribaculaceae bacterium]MDE6296580.1 MFS transporter [Muribaculaceae bacterium]